MTGSYTLSPQAKIDLVTISNYTAQHWGLDQAERYTRLFWQTVEMVASEPTMGRPCPQVRSGYYKYRSGSHFLFYRLTENGIDIVRILHERMDFTQHITDDII